MQVREYNNGCAVRSHTEFTGNAKVFRFLILIIHLRLYPSCFDACQSTPTVKIQHIQYYTILYYLCRVYYKLRRVIDRLVKIAECKVIGIR